MDWKIIPIDHKQPPLVTVESGRFVFNAAACSLIPDDGSFCYAQFFTAKEYWKTVVAVKFLTEKAENSLPVTRFYQNDSGLGEIAVADYGMISGQFLKDHEKDASVQFAVEKIDDAMLKISD